MHTSNSDRKVLWTSDENRNMKTLAEYWQKYPAKISSIFCLLGDVACFGSGAAGDNIFRALAPVVGVGAHLINVVFGKGGKTSSERFVIESNSLSPLARAFRPWQFPADTQGAMLFLTGSLTASSGLNLLHVQGFVNYPETLTGGSCMAAALVQWLMKEKESHLSKVTFSDVFTFFPTTNGSQRRLNILPLRQRLGPTRIASGIFLLGSACQVLGAFYAMFQHASLTQPKDMLMLVSGILWLYGNYHLGRVKKARAIPVA
jgi:hypothetical protein